MPSADFLALNPGYQQAGRSKYGNRRVAVDGFSFDSQAEADRYSDLLLMVKAGAISNLAVHPTFELQAAFVDATGRRHRAISYEGDFSYTEDGRAVVEDVKGMRTEVFKLKEKLFRYRYPEIDLQIVEL
jgi:hypothetical protein